MWAKTGEDANDTQLHEAGYLSTVECIVAGERDEAAEGSDAATVVHVRGVQTGPW